MKCYEKELLASITFCGGVSQKDISLDTRTYVYFKFKYHLFDHRYSVTW